MRLIAAIEDPDIARHILDCLNRPARAPPMAKVTHREVAKGSRLLTERFLNWLLRFPIIKKHRDPALHFLERLSSRIGRRVSLEVSIGEFIDDFGRMHS